MRCKRTIPYKETEALQINTATNPTKTLVAMDSRIDLHSISHAPAHALSCCSVGRSLWRGGGVRPRLGDGRGSPLGRALGAGSGVAGDGSVGGARARRDVP